MRTCCTGSVLTLELEVDVSAIATYADNGLPRDQVSLMSGGGGADESQRSIKEKEGVIGSVIGSESE